MPAWPYGCPTGWTERRKEARLRTAMETGLAKVRRRYTKNVMEVEAEWLIAPRDTGYAGVRTFYEVDCQEGTLTFTMAHPWFGVVGLFRFLSPPAFESVENKLIRVTAQLELF